MTKYESAINNPSFCVAPWIHIHARPSGEMIPCCLWDYSAGKLSKLDFGNIMTQDDMLTVMNSQQFKILRQKFLSGQKVPECHRCYDRDTVNVDNTSFSLRNWMNNTFDDRKTIDIVNHTAHDGSISELNIKYLDIRFGNICNLKCRMCDHNLSSTWFDEANELRQRKGYKQLTTKFVHADCYDKIEPFLSTVQEIYFAGGEPFLYPEHLKILNKLIALGNTQCVIKYNTNLTTLKYKTTNLIDVWQHFPNVHIGASIDGSGDVVEYIRTNLVWDQFVKNFNTVLTLAPHVRIYPSSTVGILNVETYPDFEKWALEQGWYGKYVTAINYISSPKKMNLYYMPQWYKQKMSALYMSHLQWLRDKNAPTQMITNIKEMLQKFQVEMPDDVINQHMIGLEHDLNTWKQTAGLDWTTALPHVYDMIITHKENFNE